MTTFFKIAHVLRTGYKALRAAAGIIIVAHAMWAWFKRRLPQQRKTAMAS